jgi:hypothetical protein
MSDNSFNSIDRLIEFGMGMSIAQQMVHTMNNAIKNLHIAGTQNSLNENLQSSFFCVIKEQQVGPLTESEVLQLISQKKITNDTLIWYQGMKDWQKAENVPAIIKLVVLNPPPIPL